MNKYKEALWSIDFTMHNRVKPKYLQNVEDENFEILYELVEKHEQLEKALDKACEELARINNAFERRIITTSSYWREWALEEVQEDE